MDNILSMNKNLAERLRARRKEAKLSQQALARKAAVSYGSLKRFERTGEISLSALIRLAVVLGYEDDFAHLLERKNYQSLDEVIYAK